MKLSYSYPLDFKDKHEQDKLTDLTEEEFKHLFAVPESSQFTKILRIIYFIVFLGPIRLVLCALSWLPVAFNLLVFPKFSFLFKDKKSMASACYKASWIWLRLMLLSLGIVHIKTTGKVDERTRVLVSNHLTLFDPILSMVHSPCGFAMMSGLKGMKSIKNQIELFGGVYIDRSKKDGVTNEIRRIIKDETLFPMKIFPEGKITGGNVLLGFRTGAFIEDTVIQPVTIRYTHWLCPRSISTICWLHDGAFEYLLQAFATPFYTVQIDTLEPIELTGKDRVPSESAAETQLIMANHLGVPAIRQTNKWVFQNKEKEE